MAGGKGQPAKKQAGASGPIVTVTPPPPPATTHKPPKKKSPEQFCKESLACDATHCADNDNPDTPPGGKGCVFKCYDDFRKHHGSYKYNGYHEIVANKGPTYDIDFKKDPVAAGRITLGLETDFGFSNKPSKKNYRAMVARDDPRTTGDWSLAGTTSGLKNYRDAAYAPFNHQYHHIMPWEALYKAFDGASGTSELAVLQASGYNLNRGINVIILPMSEEYAWALQLPTHFSGHPAYNRALAEMLNEVKAVLAPAKPHTLTGTTVPALKTCLDHWEIAQFPKITALGTTKTPRTKVDGSKDKKWKGIAPDIRNCELDDMMVNGTKIAPK